MRARLRSPGVGLRASVALVAGSALLGGAVGNGLSREGSQLPVAVAQLTAAVVASADALACFQGVQDDLFIDPTGDIDAASVADAQRRLATCPVRGAVVSAGRIAEPPAPLLESGRWRQIRADLVAGRADMRRGALDIKATRAAMTIDLGDHSHGANVVLAYRAAYADYVQAGTVQANAAALLDQSDTRPAPNAGP